MIMSVCRCTALELSMMWDQKLLMFCRRSILEGCSDIGTGIFAQKGGQYYDYECMPLHGSRIIHDARPKIVDTPLTLIFRRWLRYCHQHFCLERRPIVWLWEYAVAWPLNYPWCETKNCWRSVDAPLTLTLGTYHQSFGAQSFFLTIIQSLLTAVIPFLGRIICIQKHPGLSVSEPLLFTSSVR